MQHNLIETVIGKTVKILLFDNHCTSHFLWGGGWGEYTYTSVRLLKIQTPNSMFIHTYLWNTHANMNTMGGKINVYLCMKIKTEMR